MTIPASHICLQIDLWMPGEEWRRSDGFALPLRQTTQHQREAIGLWTGPQRLDPVGASGRNLIQRPWSTSGNPPQASLLPRPIWVFQTYVEGQTGRRDWYSVKDECSGRASGDGTVCDEFPLFSTTQNAAAWLSDEPYPSIKLVNYIRPTNDEANAQRSDYNAFRNACGIDSGDSFLIVPQPPGGSNPGFVRGSESFYICDE